MGTINETVTSFFEREKSSETIPSYDMLETYEKTPIFTTINIMEESVESVAQKFPVSTGPGGTDLDALQGWLLKFGEGGTRLRTSVETFLIG